MTSDSFVSVGLLVGRPVFPLKEAIAEIQRQLDANYSDYEILLIVQGPVYRFLSRTETSEIIADIPSVRVIQLASAVHPDVARSVIIENAIGDFVVIFDPSSDAPGMIVEAVSRCLAGSDIVIGVSTVNAPIGHRILRKLVTPLLASIDYRLPTNATSFRCVSRRVINAVIRTGRFYHQLNVRLQKTGYPSTTLNYTPKSGALPAPSLLRAGRRFFHVLIFNSSRPLRWMAAVGFSGSCIAFLFAIYGLTIRMLKRGVIEGWTTTVLFMSIQFMLLFVILGFISEYMSRLLDEQRGGSDYAVVFERNSATMVNDSRINVLADSLSPEVNRVQTARNG